MTCFVSKVALTISWTTWFSHLVRATTLPDAAMVSYDIERRLNCTYSTIGLLFFLGQLLSLLQGRCTAVHSTAPAFSRDKERSGPALGSYRRRDARFDSGSDSHRFPEPRPRLDLLLVSALCITTMSISPAHAQLVELLFSSMYLVTAVCQNLKSFAPLLTDHRCEISIQN